MIVAATGLAMMAPAQRTSRGTITDLAARAGSSPPKMDLRVQAMMK